MLWRGWVTAADLADEAGGGIGEQAVVPVANPIRKPSIGDSASESSGDDQGQPLGGSNSPSASQKRSVEATKLPKKNHRRWPLQECPVVRGRVAGILKEAVLRTEKRSPNDKPSLGHRPKVPKKTMQTGDSDKAENVEGILLHDGRAIELSGGLLSGSKKYAKLLNGLRAQLDPKISITSIMVPTAIGLYAPPNYRRAMRHARRVVAGVGEHLLPTIHKVDGYKAMAPYENEYLYFKTDHHWTAMGAFYVYAQYAQTIGLAGIPKTSWDWQEGRSFLGSLYGITRAPSLKRNRDHTMFPNPPMSYTARRFMEGWSPRKKGIRMRFVNPTYRGYSVFLGGDFPLVVGQTSAKNNRRVILIKNSYGNAFAPFLLPHFETVLVWTIGTLRVD